MCGREAWIDYHMPIARGGSGGRPLVYIAGPYSQGDQVVNTRAACEAGDRVWDAGYMPIVPHTSLAWHLASPKPAAHWYEYDLHLLRLCQHLIRLPGDSWGADRECVQAIKWGIKCYLGVEHFLMSMDLGALLPDPLT
jgi:hypothetical protein